jgi:hypothetical protein
MTFGEAIRLKGKQPATIIEGNKIYKVFVTPEKAEDLEKYLTDVRGFFYTLTDRDAKRYSSNRQYILRALFYNKEGPKIEYKGVSI